MPEMTAMMIFIDGIDLDVGDTSTFKTAGYADKVMEATKCTQTAQDIRVNGLLWRVSEHVNLLNMQKITLYNAINLASWLGPSRSQDVKLEGS